MTDVPLQHVEALRLIQTALSRVYHVENAVDVGPFLVDDDTLREMASAGAIEPRAGAREEVFVLDDGTDVSVALYLDERSREAASDAARGEELALSSEKFGDFCVALEGMSHFLLMQHRTHHDRPVTQLELELQAEVDKYVVARLCTWTEQVTLSELGEEPRVLVTTSVDAMPPAPQALQHRLFTGYTLADNLQSEQAQRYVTASKLALRFCRMLEEKFLRYGYLEQLVRALRSFYRKTQVERLQLIGSLA